VYIYIEENICILLLMVGKQPRTIHRLGVSLSVTGRFMSCRGQSLLVTPRGGFKPQRHVKAKLVLGGLLTSMLGTGNVKGKKSEEEEETGFGWCCVCYFLTMSACRVAWADCCRVQKVKDK